MIRFVHTADVHFGMENYGRIDSLTGIHTRLLDFEKAFNFCIDVAIEQQVDFLIFCGDAYKTTNPSPTQQKLMFQCLLRLYKANIPVVIIVGNHDNPLSFGKANTLDLFGQLPLEGFYVMDKPSTLRLETKHGPIQIVGIPWPTRGTIALSNKHMIKDASQITTYISQAVAAILQDLASKLDPEIPAIMGGHLTVSSGIFSGSEKRAIYGNDPVLLPSQLAIAPFDYIALGHLHRYQNLNPNGIPIIYSGSIERVDFGERKEDKGFCLVTIEGKGKVSHEFIKTPMRPFIQIEVELNGERNQTDQILDAIKEHDIKDAVVKILYHLPAEKKDFVDLKIVQRVCADAMYLVGIFPVRKTVPRERRSVMKINMDFTSLLETYFGSKPELYEKKDDLIKKVIMLAEEAKEKQEES